MLRHPIYLIGLELQSVETSYNKRICYEILVCDCTNQKNYYLKVIIWIGKAMTHKPAKI